MCFFPTKMSATLLMAGAVAATAFVGVPKFDAANSVPKFSSCAARPAATGLRWGNKFVCSFSNHDDSLSNVTNSNRASAIKYGEMQHAGVLVQDVPSAVKFYTEVWYSNLEYSNNPEHKYTNTKTNACSFPPCVPYHIRGTKGQGGCLVRGHTYITIVV